MPQTTTNDKRPAVAVSSPAPDRVRLVVGQLTVNGLVSDPYPAAAATAAAAGVASFRNLQYARIAGRWHEAVPVDLPSTVGVWDATRWGPRPPQTLDIMHCETRHLYPRMSVFDSVSEFDCLNLNIYTPLATLQAAATDTDTDTPSAASAALLPVIVWIHGGSFEWGDGGSECGTYRPRKNLRGHPRGRETRMLTPPAQTGSSSSAARSRPASPCWSSASTTGWARWASSRPRSCARRRAPAARPATAIWASTTSGWLCNGFVSALVLWLSLVSVTADTDQVARHIRIFGGDPSRITMAGESAGAISVLAHLRGNVPVARNALIMSSGTVGPVPFAAARAGFDQACAALGLAHTAPAAAKLAALRRLPFEQLYALAAGRLDTMLCEDPLFFADWAGQRFEALPALPAWIDRVVVGQLCEETSTRYYDWSLRPAPELLADWRALYTAPGYADEVLAVYGVDTGKSTQAADVARALVACTSDALFSLATYSTAVTHLGSGGGGGGGDDGDDGRAYLYRVDQPDLVATHPDFRGHAYHSLDNAYLFCFPAVAGPDAPPAMREAAAAFSGAALDLAHGDSLWPPLRRGAANTHAVYSGTGRHAEALAEPRWLPLVDTEERYQQFMRSKDIIWTSSAIAAERLLRTTGGGSA